MTAMPSPIFDTSDLPDEVWRPITRYEELYEVSNLGRVKSLSKYGRRSRMLRQNIKHHGYRSVCLYRNAKQSRYMVHRLVLAAFTGECPPGHEACHRDGDPSNNTVENLYWGTAVDNAQDRIRHGHNHQLRKTHCPQGHPYDAANTRLYRNNWRYCIACNAEYKAAS